MSLTYCQGHSANLSLELDSCHSATLLLCYYLKMSGHLSVMFLFFCYVCHVLTLFCHSVNNSVIMSVTLSVTLLVCYFVTMLFTVSSLLYTVSVSDSLSVHLCVNLSASCLIVCLSVRL